MQNYPSNSTLLRPGTVAELAGIARPTLYSWLDAGWVRNSFDAEGTPLFSKEDAELVRALAERRREAEERRKLPKVSA